jgi:hypothetical protein
MGMKESVILDNEVATLWYCEEHKMIHHLFKKYIRGELFHLLLETGYDELVKNKAIRWLSDDRLNPVLHPEDQKWATEIWFPKTIQAGWKFWAIVMPEKVVAQVSMKSLAKEHAEHGLTTMMFSDLDKASDWLINQK